MGFLDGFAVRSADAEDHGLPILVAGALGLVCGVAAAMLLAGTAAGGPYWSAGFVLVVYLFAAVAISGVLGLIFAVPRSRTDGALPSSGRYLANSNLEQISDWLTKLLVGAGLVQLGALPGGLANLGDFLGADSEIPNAEATTVMLVLYGSGVGFLFVYLWVRLRLRVLLEATEQQAEDQWRTAEIAEALTEATNSSEVTETKSKIERVALQATTALAGRSAADLKAVLWVDDSPQNNASLVTALEQRPDRRRPGCVHRRGVAAIQRAEVCGGHHRPGSKGGRHGKRHGRSRSDLQAACDRADDPHHRVRRQAWGTASFRADESRGRAGHKPPG